MVILSNNSLTHLQLEGGRYQEVGVHSSGTVCSDQKLLINTGMLYI